MAGIRLVKHDELEQVKDNIKTRAETDYVDKEVANLESEIGSKANIDHKHNYNDLDDKPNIPSVDGLAKKSDLDDLAKKVTELRDMVEELKGDEKKE